MKICAIICEFNPFHNGHSYLIQQAKESGADAVLCIMSGSFTQRGEICILDKYKRAKHAVLSGTDCVVELPTAFSVAPAEIFARGAIKILSSVPDVKTLAFGCESGSSEEFYKAAKILLSENEEFKRVLQKNLDLGLSYIKSYTAAFKSVGGNAEILQNPNNILAVEYTKAILRANTDIEILPIERVGGGYNDCNLNENFSSASAIRQNIFSPLLKNNVPDCVFADLSDFSTETERYNYCLQLILSRTPSDDLKKIYGCNEGLENALKNLQNLPVDEIIKILTSKRYSSSRIKRILCANFLGLYKDKCESFLNSDLYIFPLALKKESADAVMSALSKSKFPVLTSGSNQAKLGKTAAECKLKDDFAYMQWQQITGKNCDDKLLIL